MTGININIHNLNEISIKDLSHDLNISDAKWDSLINCFFKISEATYFYGIWKNYLNDELKRDIVFLSEEELLMKKSSEEYYSALNLQT